MGQQFGDTTLTKVFVGGLAWETQKEALREHFENYGEILEAVVIADKVTGRSKGYGFVTFKDPEAAKKACEDATPVINGRRANCNIASLGAKRGSVRSSSPSTPAPLPTHHLHQPIPAGMAISSRGVSSGPPAPWYYHPSSGTPSPFQPQQYHGIFPFYAATAAYGYGPNYVTDVGYNTQKPSHGGVGGFCQGQFSYPTQGGGLVAHPNGMLPMYPFYHFQNHQSQGMAVPAHFFASPTAATGPMATIPTIMSKPTAMPPATVCVAVEQVTGCR